MNEKSITLSIVIVFLILILYLLGLRIRVKVGNINNIKMANNENKTEENTSISTPAPSEAYVSTPSPSYYEKKEIEKMERNSYLGPYGYVTKDMIEQKNQYPHHNPMMFQKPELVFLNNITE